MPAAHVLRFAAHARFAARAARRTHAFARARCAFAFTTTRFPLHTTRARAFTFTHTFAPPLPPRLPAYPTAFWFYTQVARFAGSTHIYPHRSSFAFTALLLALFRRRTTRHTRYTPAGSCTGARFAHVCARRVLPAVFTHTPAGCCALYTHPRTFCTHTFHYYLYTPRTRQHHHHPRGAAVYPHLRPRPTTTPRTFPGFLPRTAPPATHRYRVCRTPRAYTALHRAARFRPARCRAARTAGRRRCRHGCVCRGTLRAAAAAPLPGSFFSRCAPRPAPVCRFTTRTQSFTAFAGVRSFGLRLPCYLAALPVPTGLPSMVARVPSMSSYHHRRLRRLPPPPTCCRRLPIPTAPVPAPTYLRLPTGFHGSFLFAAAAADGSFVRSFIRSLHCAAAHARRSKQTLLHAPLPQHFANTFTARICCAAARAWRRRMVAAAALRWRRRARALFAGARVCARFGTPFHRAHFAAARAARAHRACRARILPLRARALHTTTGSRTHTGMVAARILRRARARFALPVADPVPAWLPRARARALHRAAHAHTRLAACRVRSGPFHHRFADHRRPPRCRCCCRAAAPWLRIRPLPHARFTLPFAVHPTRFAAHRFPGSFPTACAGFASGSFRTLRRAHFAAARRPHACLPPRRARARVLVHARCLPPGSCTHVCAFPTPTLPVFPSSPVTYPRLLRSFPITCPAPVRSIPTYRVSGWLPVHGSPPPLLVCATPLALLAHGWFATFAAPRMVLRATLFTFTLHFTLRFCFAAARTFTFSLPLLLRTRCCTHFTTTTTPHRFICFATCTRITRAWFCCTFYPHARFCTPATFRLHCTFCCHLCAHFAFTPPRWFSLPRTRAYFYIFAHFLPLLLPFYRIKLLPLHTTFYLHLPPVLCPTTPHPPMPSSFFCTAHSHARAPPAAAALPRCRDGLRARARARAFARHALHLRVPTRWMVHAHTFTCCRRVPRAAHHALRAPRRFAPHAHFHHLHAHAAAPAALVGWFHHLCLLVPFPPTCTFYIDGSMLFLLPVVHSFIFILCCAHLPAPRVPLFVLLFMLLWLLDG